MMQLTDDMRRELSEVDEKEGYWASHVVIFPKEPDPECKEWPYDWDAHMVKGYTRAQELTAEMAAEGVTDTLIFPMYKL